MSENKDRHAGRKAAAQARQIPALEWIAASTGLILTLGMIGFIGWNAYRGSGDEPPAITMQVEDVVPTAAGFVVRVKAVNLAMATGAAVHIRGELKQGGRTVETSEMSLDYVPGRSQPRGGLVFERDPRCCRLEMRAVGYAEP